MGEIDNYLIAFTVLAFIAVLGRLGLRWYELRHGHDRGEGGHSNSACRRSGGDQRTESDDLGSNRPPRRGRFQGRLHLTRA